MLVCFLAIMSTALFITVNISSLLVDYPKQLLRHFNSEELASDYRRLLTYLQLPWIWHLHLHFIPLTLQASHHFCDVRHLLLLNEAVLVITVPLAWWSLEKQKRRHQLWQLMIPLKVIIYVFVLTSWLPLISFPASFIKLHFLLFQNRDWILNPRFDPVILLMPTSFFLRLALIWLAVSLVLLIALWGWLYLDFFKLGTQKSYHRRN